MTHFFRGVYSIEAWTQPASLKKREGTKIMHIFVKTGGKEKLRGKRLNYVSTYLHCLPLIFSKIFSVATLARLHFIFIPRSGDTEHIPQGRDGNGSWVTIFGWVTWVMSH